jgi:SPP1 family predicted phage head-tail adaptor
MRAGQLRKLVTIQSQGTGQTDTGAPDSTWTDEVQDVPCAVLPQDGREFIAAQQVDQEITHIVIMRWLAGFSAVRHRLVLEGRILNVLAVLDIEERHRELRVKCKELAGA